ncbi:hypothetical protein HN592_02675 [Candidatus Woesearchaeota archaeon]|jgi:hypothetical protein|nr:hypothetical protein [Candidatus Woesearchaeota archaeon]MBT4368116.1 hypothetical protein [Candidatus Woesearchaeota archaeon]MBT4712604.1 hypothetical protein [Candidatus Woesearchaeota archaeon]MBT6639517.1 hypothetical protein [Candidatus Woesearchaeota archaeon]MBT7133689.1 hypothetical protein [Candidatus Woesearchaeota archaeon]
MVNPLYLTPPTVGELCWASLIRNESPLFALAKMRSLLGPVGVPNLLREQFAMDELCNVVEQEPNDVLRGLTYIELDLLTTGDNAFEQLAAVQSFLSPNATLRRGGGDCKSFVILYVALQRAKGRAARFGTYEGNHIITELDVEGGCNSRMWLRHDPRWFPLTGPLTNSDEGYSEAYEIALDMLNQ